MQQTQRPSTVKRQDPHQLDGSLTAEILQARMLEEPRRNHPGAYHTHELRNLVSPTIPRHAA